MLIQFKNKSDISNISYNLKRLLPTGEAAQYLSICRSQLNTIIKTEKNRRMKFGKRRIFNLIDLDAFIEELKSDRTIYNHYCGISSKFMNKGGIEWECLQLKEWMGWPGI
jgi:hypothetical protein